MGAKGKGAVGGGQFVGVEALAARGAVASEPVAIIARHPAADLGTVVGILFLRGDRNREQQRQGHDHQAAHISLPLCQVGGIRSEEHTSELQSLMRISYAVFCLKKKKTTPSPNTATQRKNTPRKH